MKAVEALVDRWRAESVSLSGHDSRASEFYGKAAAKLRTAIATDRPRIEALRTVAKAADIHRLNAKNHRAECDAGLYAALDRLAALDEEDAS